MKNVIAVFLGVFASILVALFFMPHTEEANSIPVVNEVNTKAVQVGVFVNEDKALESANKLSARVIKEDGYYYLYFSVLSDAENLKKVSDYLDSQGIKHFLKVISASSEFTTELIQYEEMMKKTTSNIAFLELNKRIMDRYEATYEN